MKIKIDKKEYDIINAFNTNTFIDGANRESKQFTVAKDFDMSLFTDDMEATLIYDDGTTESLDDYCILGEIHLKRNNNIVWLCKKTTEELQRELIESLLA